MTCFLVAGPALLMITHTLQSLLLIAACLAATALQANGSISTLLPVDDVGTEQPLRGRRCFCSDGVPYLWHSGRVPDLLVPVSAGLSY